MSSNLSVISCAVASAVAFFLSGGTLDVWPLAWLAPAPVLWLAYGATPTGRLAAASFAAAALGSLYFVVPYGRVLAPLELATVIVPSAAAFAGAVLFGRAAWRRSHPLVASLAFPAFWTTFEFLATKVSPHGSFGAWAYTQVSAPALIQSASLLGLWSITFLLAYVANAVALGLRNVGAARGVIAAAAALFVANLAFGGARLAAPGGETLRIGLAAGDIPLTSPIPSGPAAAVAVSEQYAAVASSLAAQGAKLVVLPELTAVVAPPWRDRAMAPLANAARAGGTPIVIGFVEVTQGGEFNAALTFKPDASMARYVKRHTLLPYDRTVRGTSPGLLADGRSVAICKDMDYPETIRADALHGLNLMLVPAADFERDRWLHARIAVLRGVENGMAIARAARNGLLTLTDDRGRVVGAVRSGEAAIASMVADVPLGSGGSIYRAIGDVFGWACLLATGVLAILGLLRRSPARGTSAPGGQSSSVQ